MTATAWQVDWSQAVSIPFYAPEENIAPERNLIEIALRLFLPRISIHAANLKMKKEHPDGPHVGLLQLLLWTTISKAS